MKRMTFAIAAMVIFGNAAWPVLARPNEPLSGKDSAQMLCASCHDVSGTKLRRDTLGDGSPPAFALIAKDPKMTPAAIRQLLRLPHGKMDNVTLTQREIDGLVIYIQSFNVTQP